MMYAQDYDEAIVGWFKIREYPGQRCGSGSGLAC
jgi:hypothetical protein